MTKYMGGKGRQGKVIAAVLSRLDCESRAKSIKSTDSEPVARECGVMKHIRAPMRIGSDIHEDVIEMWKAVQTGWKPPRHISKEKFNKLKYSKTVSPEKAFAGYALSFKGVYFHSYFDRDYDAEREKVIACKRDIQDVCFFTGSYDEFQVPKQPAIFIYCDPPYDDGTHKDIGKGASFDSRRFWNWVREQSRYHTVVVSEKKAPKDFVSIWQSSDKIPQYLFLHKSLAQIKHQNYLFHTKQRDDKISRWQGAPRC